MIFARSYVTRSGQFWKMWLFFGLSLASGVLLFRGFNVGEEQPSSFMALVLAGTGFGAISLFWLSMSIRCKNCKTRLGWRAISKESHNAWLLSLLTSDCCPVCNDIGIQVANSGLENQV